MEKISKLRDLNKKKRTGNVIILLTLNGCASKKFGKIPRKLLVEIRDIKFDTE